MLNVIYADCRNQAHNAECLYAECRYAGCRYAECRGAVFEVETDVIIQPFCCK